jgi:hypothetical protein
MPWLTPTAIAPVAVVLVLILAWPRLREATSFARLFLEVVGLAVATIALIAATWALYWYVQQRW